MRPTAPVSAGGRRFWAHSEPPARAVRGRELRRTPDGEGRGSDCGHGELLGDGVQGAQNLEGSLDGGKIAVLSGGGVEVHELVAERGALGE